MSTQTDIANILGRSQTTISLIATGKRHLSKKSCERMVELCGGTIKTWKRASYKKIKSSLEKKHIKGKTNCKVSLNKE